MTLTGPGGVGKTRLAAEVTAQRAAVPAERVWWVELAPVAQPERVSAVVAAVLGAQQRTDRTVIEAIAEVLSGERSLLVLDNCEHVLAAVAQLCAGLLSHRDEVRVLATSREALGVPGEARLRLRPLAVPKPGAAGPAAGDGAALFVDRARLADAAFQLTAESARVVDQIVARLDGLPLAIELAAARSEALGLIQLLQLLDHPLTVLNQGARTTTPRHRSLRETVDWSYRLLTEQQRRVFRRVGIFCAPFTLDAANAVAGDGAEQALLHLVDCCLITPPAQAPDGTARYWLLEGPRAFALEQLIDAGEQPDAAAAMCGYYVVAAARAAQG